MRVFQEFKNFAMKGSVVDLAVGVIIGGAFGKIVSSLVENILMPPLGLIVGGMDFSQLKFILKSVGPDGKGEVAIGYGMFLQNTVNFLIIAWALFVVIQFMNRMRVSPQPVPAAPSPPPPEDIVLLREIRDALKAR